MTDPKNHRVLVFVGAAGVMRAIQAAEILHQGAGVGAEMVAVDTGDHEFQERQRIMLQQKALEMMARQIAFEPNHDIRLERESKRRDWEQRSRKRRNR